MPLVLLLATQAHASPIVPEAAARQSKASNWHAHTRHGLPIRAGLRHAARPHAHTHAIASDVEPGDATVQQASDVIDQGVASWYGGRHNGRLTSSGSRFDETQMTAAHAWLPLGSRVRVTSRATGSSVIVTINDRQRSRYRVIDLSKAAADEIGMRGRGITLVTITHG